MLVGNSVQKKNWVGSIRERSATMALSYRTFQISWIIYFSLQWSQPQYQSILMRLMTGRMLWCWGRLFVIVPALLAYARLPSPDPLFPSLKPVIIYIPTHRLPGPIPSFPITHAWMNNNEFHVFTSLRRMGYCALWSLCQLLTFHHMLLIIKHLVAITLPCWNFPSWSKVLFNCSVLTVVSRNVLRLFSSALL